MEAVMVVMEMVVMKAVVVMGVAVIVVVIEVLLMLTDKQSSNKDLLSEVISV